MVSHVFPTCSCSHPSSKLHLEFVCDVYLVCLCGKLSEIQPNSATRRNHGNKHILACCCDNGESNCNVIRSRWGIFFWKIRKCLESGLFVLRIQWFLGTTICGRFLTINCRWPLNIIWGCTITDWRQMTCVCNYRKIISWIQK